MATEHNQNTKSMDSLERNASNTITNDTDRKHSSQDIKCEISTDKHQNEIQIYWTTTDRIFKYGEMPLDCPDCRNEVVRLKEEKRHKKYGSIKVVRKTDEVWRLRKTDDEE